MIDFKYLFKGLACSLLAVLIFCVPGGGASADLDREALAALLEVLEEETGVATKTRMNSDYVPGMVTILHGEHLTALGLSTVGEALSLVPGIQLSRIQSGEPTLKVRGLAFPFNAGKVKVLLNSIALSRESSGINSSVLRIPVEQVDRIEVIRGPGSSLYGDFALAGVVNIITRKTGNLLFARAGTKGSETGGGLISHETAKKEFHISGNISLSHGGDHGAAAALDPEEDRSVGVFQLGYKGFNLTAQGIRRRVELDHLPPSQPFPVRRERRERSWAVEARQAFEPDRNLEVETYISFLRNDFHSTAPPGEFLGNRLEAGGDMNWSGWSGHRILLGLSFSESDIDDALDKPAFSAPLRISGINRRAWSLGLQDEVSLGDNFLLTLGGRLDDRDDVGGILTPRIAAVYRPGGGHVVKAQYAHGFHAPTFWELYDTGTANTTLDYETIETTELVYIFRGPEFVSRATLFYSRLDDMPARNADGSFSNALEVRSRGIELEWEQQLNERFRWQANVSFVDTWDQRAGSGTGGHSPGVSDWLGNLAFFYRIFPDWLISGRLLHVGDRHDADGWVDGYDRLDITVSRTNFLDTGAVLRLGVSNILGDSITYLTQRPGHPLQGAEYGGLSFRVGISWEF